MSHRTTAASPIGPTSDIMPWSEVTSGTRSIGIARALRDEGLTYTGISIVMRVYHDDDRTPASWRSTLRYMGAPPSRRLGSRPQQFPRERSQ